MSKLMRLMMILGVALLVLTACGEPAYVYEGGHGEDAEHAAADDHEAADDHAAEDDHAEAEDDHAEDEAAEEGEHADDDAMAAEEETHEGEDAEATEGEDEAHEDEAAAAESEETAMADDSAAAGDPAVGEELFNTLYNEVGFACATCHRIDSEEQLIGPGLLNISVNGADRVEGLDAPAYIYQSITEPNVYVVENYPENLMPQTYTELFTEEQIQDIVAYVLTLNG